MTKKVNYPLDEKIANPNTEAEIIQEAAVSQLSEEEFVERARKVAKLVANAQTPLGNPAMDELIRGYEATNLEKGFAQPNGDRIFEVHPFSIDPEVAKSALSNKLPELLDELRTLRKPVSMEIGKIYKGTLWGHGIVFEFAGAISENRIDTSRSVYSKIGHARKGWVYHLPDSIEECTPAECFIFDGATRPTAKPLSDEDQEQLEAINAEQSFGFKILTTAILIVGVLVAVTILGAISKLIGLW